MTDIPHGLVTGKVLHKIQWTDQLFSLQVSAPVSPYQAGQFTKLGLLNSEDEFVRRAYSMVNAPEHEQGHQHLEFLIIKDQNGQLSPQLHELKVGDDIFVGKDPSGFMTLDEIPEIADDLWMLSTGTAVGPFISMLESMQIQQQNGSDVEKVMSFKNLVLVHAVRTEQDLTYRDRIAQLVNHFQGKLQYVPIISRESVTGTLRGRIPSLLLGGDLEQTTFVAFNQTRSFFYLCGNPQMVRDTSEALTSLGFEKHLRRKPGQFSSENYW
ncbi:ferredoxin--NADP reductase [Vibrio splendidus]|uniref:ferredoxin--NADP reductase n=1 Tax=Vibrio splendidus TaxID=29497 RepID=UPI000C8623E5|nr:ferredoxin--NADP reductase [Vibrio splendidus]MBT9242594.1 ferredoxin--NADP reductase [Vibrio splendidus]MDP2616384.1 ferredoxin--NADP reductase [Vibrio splendidus]PMO91785.1 ferredoxin--NADP(+) reductase [Vibrio splendidus]PMP21739.1 ferredoxin--NADP(+) reductase [Vibrio splendidus]PMP27181.1 ferredoxin--NADP(+) reductase [Vibrio splendidus]